MPFPRAATRGRPLGRWWALSAAQWALRWLISRATVFCSDPPRHQCVFPPRRDRRPRRVSDRACAPSLPPARVPPHSTSPPPPPPRLAARACRAPPPSLRARRGRWGWGRCGSPRAGHTPPSSSCRRSACSRPRHGRPRRVALPDGAGADSRGGRGLGAHTRGGLRGRGGRRRPGCLAAWRVRVRQRPKILRLGCQTPATLALTLPYLLGAAPRVPRPSPPPCTARSRALAAGARSGCCSSPSAPRVESSSCCVARRRCARAAARRRGG